MPLALVLIPATVWVLAAILGGVRGTVTYFLWSLAGLVGLAVLVVVAIVALAVVLA